MVFAACLCRTSAVCCGGVKVLVVRLSISSAISSPYLVPTYWMIFSRVVLSKSADVRCPISKTFPSSSAHSPLCVFFTVVVVEDRPVPLPAPPPHPLPLPGFLPRRDLFSRCPARPCSHAGESPVKLIRTF